MASQVTKASQAQASSDDGARDAAGLTAADGLVEEHLKLGPPEQQADLESLHHRS